MFLPTQGLKVLLIEQPAPNLINKFLRKLFPTRHTRALFGVDETN